MDTKEKMMNIVLIFFGISLVIIPSVYSYYIANTTDIFGSAIISYGSWTSETQLIDGDFGTAASLSNAGSSISARYVILENNTYRNLNVSLDWESGTPVTRTLDIYNWTSAGWDTISAGLEDVNVTVPELNDYIDTNNISLQISSDCSGGRSDNVNELYIDSIEYLINSINLVSPLSTDTISESEDVIINFSVFTKTDSYATCNYTINTTASEYFNVTNNTYYSSNLGKYITGTHNITINCTETDEEEILESQFNTIPNYFNITISDEMTGDSLTFNITISNSSHSYTWINQTEFFENSTDPNIPIGYITITISSYGYEDRDFEETFSDSVPPIIEDYYLLSSADGSLTRFHVENSIGSAIEDVDVNAYKSIGGSTVLIDNTVTDASGTATFWLNPTSTYTFEFIKSDYTSINYTVVASSSDYTIVMSSSGTTTATEQLTNITYRILPQNNVTNSSTNNVTYSFYINSRDSKLEWFSLNVTHDGVNLFNDNSTAAGGGTLSQDLNMSLLYGGKPVILTAMFKKANITTPFNITYSYYIWNEGRSAGTDIKSISDLLRTDLDLDNTDATNKIFMSLGVVIFSMIAGAIVSNQIGSGMLGLVVIGIGLSIGLMSFAGADSPIVVVSVFGLLVLAYFSVMYIRSGL